MSPKLLYVLTGGASGLPPNLINIHLISTYIIICIFKFG